MSSTLYWRPVEDYGKTLPDDLKFKLREYFGMSTVMETLDKSDVPYLTGLKQCGVRGAAELIKAIKAHGEVEISERF